MENDMRKRVTVAATAAKAAGFDGTYVALLDLLRELKSAETHHDKFQNPAINSLQKHS